MDKLTENKDRERTNDTDPEDRDTTYPHHTHPYDQNKVKSFY